MTVQVEAVELLFRGVEPEAGYVLLELMAGKTTSMAIALCCSAPWDQLGICLSSFVLFEFQFQVRFMNFLVAMLRFLANYFWCVHVCYIERLEHNSAMQGRAQVHNANSYAQ